jgi:sterol desaturase/sphingolipid hydroxylase (fatty acid hydroxylase superfamily)
MDHHNHHHLAQAVDALTASHPHPAHTLTPDELVIAMADLATLAGLLGQLAAQTRRQLAPWATVGAHLYQAEQHAGQLRRCLSHACATFAFTTSPPTAA